MEKGITDKEHDDIMKQIGQPSKFTEAEYKKQWPSLLPQCTIENQWWDEMMEQNPDIRKESEDAHREYCHQQGTEYFTHKILLRIFLEEHSLFNKNHVLQGDFTLHYEGKKVTIKPIVPDGKTFEFIL